MLDGKERSLTLETLAPKAVADGEAASIHGGETLHSGMLKKHSDNQNMVIGKLA